MGSKNTVDCDCSHEIRRQLVLCRKTMTNLDSVLKSKDITLLTKIRIVKAMVLLIIMYGCESWTIKKAEHWRIYAFQLWCWRRLLRVPLRARRSNQSILQEINSEYSFEGLMLKQKLQYFGHLIQRPTHWKRPWCCKRLRAEGEEATEDEMAGQHHRLYGRELGPKLGDGKGHGSLACYRPWGWEESDVIWQLNNNNKNTI